MFRNYFCFFLILIFLLFLAQSVSAFGPFLKLAQNPVLDTSDAQWDSARVFSPSVIQSQNKSFLFYTGFDNSRFRVGQASSSGYINWTKYVNNPIINLIPSINKDSHDQTVLYESGNYIMWYAASDNAGSTNFSIRRATSPDGENWTDDTNNPVFDPQSGWGASTISHPFVLNDGAEYKMWFNSADGGNWQIGLATSPDGINWTSYAGNPVLTDTTSWEHSNFGGSSVIFDGSTYHMWYSTNSPFSINYATSTDGINWIKPSDQNPVLLPGAAGTFDSQVVADPSVITLSNGTTLIYYSSLGLFNGQSKIRIGLAADGPIPELSPSPTATPTPIETTKVVVVPGFGGSWNADALLNCKSEEYEGTWVMNPLAQDIYMPITDALSQSGMLPLTYLYDWRKQVASHAASLADYIESNTVTNENVHMVGHSMGGLVGRAYLEDKQENHRLDHLMSAGSSHQGIIEAYPAWAAGEVWNDNFLFRVALTTLLRRCGQMYGTSDRESVQQFVPSTQNLLPVFDYLRDMKSDVLKQVASMQIQNNWLPTSNFSPPFFDATVGSLVGTGEKTLQEIEVKDANKKQVQDGDWLDGAPTKKETSNDGDGTVLETSSSVAGADNSTMPLSHIGVIADPLAVQTILDFLGVSSPQIVSAAQEPTSALIVMSYPSIFAVTDPDGKTKLDKSGMVAFANPKKGTYKLILQPKKFGNDIIVAQFLSDGRTFWKEYKHNSILPKFGSLKFDPDKPADDILK